MSTAAAATLGELLDAAGGRHPRVIAAEFEVAAARDGIEAARRQYWPTLSVVAETGSTDAQTTRLLRAQQTLWNGGATAAGVEIAEVGQAVADARLATQRTVMARQVVEAWQSLWSAHARARVSLLTFQRLEGFQTMMQRRVSGELSTKIDLELVRARMLQIQVDIDRAQNDGRAAVRRLEQLSGMRNLQTRIGTLDTQYDIIRFDADIARLRSTQLDLAVEQQPEVLQALQEARLVRSQVGLKRAQTRPQLYARLDQSLTGTRNLTAYVGVSYTPGAGFSSHLEIEAQAKRAQAAEEGLMASRVELLERLVSDQEELKSYRSRLESLASSVAGSSQVLSSYERQFAAGRKSWQDLMNSVRELSQNEIAFVEEQAGLVGALLRLQLRLEPDLINGSLGAAAGRERGSHKAGELQ